MDDTTTVGVPSNGHNALGFDAFAEGRTFVTPSRSVFEHDIGAFAYLTGDWHAVHSDLEVAGDGAFDGLVAHGLLVLSIVSGLFARAGLLSSEAAALAFLGLDWQMTRAVRPRDTIRAEVVVTAARPSRSNPARGIVEFEFTVLNQLDLVVGRGHWKNMFARSLQPVDGA